MINKELMVAVPFGAIENMNGYDIAIFSYLYALCYNSYLPEGKLHISSTMLRKYIKVSIVQISDTMKKLVKFGVVQDSDKNYTIDAKTLITRDDMFTLLPFNDVEKIVKNIRTVWPNVLEYYYWILTSTEKDVESMGYRHFVTIKPYAYFQKIMNMNPTTLWQYGKCLEKIGVLYIFRVRNKYLPNLMGLVRYKDAIDEYAAAHGYYARVNMKVAGIIHKYNAMIRGTKYSEEEIKEIREGIIHYNAYHPGKEKDLSVFA